MADHAPVLNPEDYDILLIGGSAGSFSIVNKLLAGLPEDYYLPIVMCLHRLKDKREGFQEALRIKSRLPVREPHDRQMIEPGTVYLAPSNYHLLFDNKEQFGLAITELVQYSRPSIDVLFDSATDIYGQRVLCVLLSGANRDGALGAKRVIDAGGTVLVQHPSDSVMDTMPKAALDSTEIEYSLPSDDILETLQNLNTLATAV